MIKRRRAASAALSVMLSAAMIVAPMHVSAYAADEDSGQTQEQTVSSFQFKYPTQHTFAEINQYYKEHPYNTELADKYDITPDISNKEINDRIGEDTTALLDAKGKSDRDTLAGSLSQETLTNALNATNFMRYSTGLQLLYIHTNDRIGGYQWRAQAGAALMAELNSITHNVSGTDANAAGIVNGVFGWAKAGPGGSNIVAGSGVANKMVNAFMPDIGNDRTGLSHRSYILNPALSGTGFGAANLSGTNKAGKQRGSAVAMFVTYFGSDPDGLTAVQWPSNRQPIETFLARGTWTMDYPADNPYQGNPWSYFINTDNAKVDTSKFKVTLECDGKQTDVLDYNNLTDKEKSENRLFTISSFPLKKLVAFRPHVAYNAGDKVTVTIEGIVDQNNLDIPVTYDVHFFATGTEPHPNLTQTTTVRTAVDTATFNFESDYAGSVYYVVKDATEDSPTSDEVLAGTKVNVVSGENNLSLAGLTGDGAKKIYYITASSTAEGKDYTTASKNGEMSEIKSADIDIAKYSITYTNTKGATNTNPTEYTIETEDIELQNLSGVSGYNFAGWVDESGETVTYIKKGSIGNRTLRATWIKIENTPEVKVDAIKGGGTIKVNGQTITSGKSINYTPGKPLKISWQAKKSSSSNVSLIKSISVNSKDQSAATKIDKSKWQVLNTAYKQKMGEDVYMTTYDKIISTEQSINIITSNAVGDLSINVEFAEYVPVYRLYNQITSEHLFTTDKTEYDAWVAMCDNNEDYWIGEGIDWFAPASGGTQVYRLYNASLGSLGRSSHYYTSDVNEKDELINKYGWKEEELTRGFQSGGTIPIYTCYNEYLGSAHHYTSSKSEWESLANHGWDLEKNKNTASGKNGVFQAVMSAKP